MGDLEIVPASGSGGAWRDSRYVEMWEDSSDFIKNYTLKSDSVAINKGINSHTYLPTSDFPDFNFETDVIGQGTSSYPCWK